MSESTSDDGLPPLREVIERHQLAAKKSLGQNFLFDLNLTRRIARAAAPLQDATIVEIGPGPGGLTRALLAEGAKHVIAIERDPRAMSALQQIADHYPGRLTLIEGDALQTDWQKLVSGPSRIVANLPYNVGTQLLIGWLSLEPWPPIFDSFTLMFQKEVALRIAAHSDTSDFGRLSVLAQWRCEARRLFDVNRSAFTPPPKITSSIVQLVPRRKVEIPCPVNALEQITAAGFGQRRKMLRSSLKSVFENPEHVLNELGIDPTKRAEQLQVSDFARLAMKL